MAQTTAPWAAPNAEVAPSGPRTRHQGLLALVLIPVGIIAAALALHALRIGAHTPAETQPTYSVKADFCTYRAAAGTVQNLSDKPSDVSVWVNFVDSDGTQLASGLGSVYNLAPGATARWSAPPAGEVSGNFTCKVAKVDQYRS